MTSRRLTMDEMKKIHICKNCKRPEYWGKFRWLSGSMICRNCYRAIWESENKKIYIWDDLDGRRPTMEEYKKQEAEEFQKCQKSYGTKIDQVFIDEFMEAKK